MKSQTWKDSKLLASNCLSVIYVCNRKFCKDCWRKGVKCNGLSYRRRTKVSSRLVQRRNRGNHQAHATEELRQAPGSHSRGTKASSRLTQQSQAPVTRYSMASPKAVVSVAESHKSTCKTHKAPEVTKTQTCFSFGTGTIYFQAGIC